MSEDGKIAAAKPSWLDTLRLAFFGRPVEGFVDRVVAREVIGWAYDPGRPNRSIMVAATCDGAVVAEALADLPRNDLQAAGKGDGRHGFRLRLPEAKGDGLAPQIRIEAMIGRRRILLSRGIVTVGDESPETNALVTSLTAGFIESIGRGAIRGWAVNPNQPAYPARVDFFDGEVYLGSAVADADRPRLQKMGAPTGARGFVFVMPGGRKLTAPANLRARISGTRHELRHRKPYITEADDADDRDMPAEAVAVLPAARDSSTPSAAAPVPVGHAPTTDVVFLVCGDLGADAFAEIAAACALQSGASVAIAALQTGDKIEALPAPLTVVDNDAGLRALVAQARTVVFLPRGHRPGPHLAEVLVRSPLTADILYWDPAILRPFDGLSGADLRHAVRLGASLEGGFAIRAGALGAFRGDLFETLTRDGTAAVSRWAAAETAFAWMRLSANLSFARSPLLRRGPPAPPPAPPPRLTLGVWSGWSEAPPQVLMEWLSQAADFEVEVLTPASGAAAWEARVRSVLADRAPKILNFRPIPDWQGDACGRLRRLAEASTGQVLLLCSGGVSAVPSGALADLTGWAAAEGAGPVTLALRSTDGAMIAGAGLQMEASGGFVLTSSYAPELDGSARPVLAAAPMCLAVSRVGLDAAGGFDDDYDAASAALDLALRMRAQRRCAILLGQHVAQLDGADATPWLRPAISPVVQALLHEDMLVALFDYPPPFPSHGVAKLAARSAG